MLMSPYFDRSLLSDSAENELGLKWTVLNVGESETGRSGTRVEVFLANGDGNGSEQTVSGQNRPNQSKCKSGRSKNQSGLSRCEIGWPRNLQWATCEFEGLPY